MAGDAAPADVVTLRGDFIALDALLKAAGLAASGGAAKGLIASGGVRVNGEIETRRGRKLRAGDEVVVGGRRVRLRAQRPSGSEASGAGLDIDRSVVAALAPTGSLRAAINLGNPILAGSDPGTGEPRGVSIDLAHAIAGRLGVALEPVVFATAGESVEAVTNERADIGFFAIDPARGARVAFTPPYLLIEGCYLVRDGSPIRSNDEVDRAGLRVVVGAGSAYDLHLTRELKQAQIVRAPSSPAVVDTFLARQLEVAAGVKQQLETDARRLPGLRLLDGRFMVIRQAMGLPRSRGEAALRCLAAFVEEMKESGFVAEALRRHGIEGASVAPAGG